MRAALYVCAGVLLGVGAAAAPLTAQDVTGTWVLSVDLSAGSGDATFVLEQRGDSIRGTYTGVLGEQPVRGTVQGDQVTLTFSQAQVGRVTYHGTVDGDTMRGTCAYGQLGDGTFSGSRQSGSGRRAPETFPLGGARR